MATLAHGTFADVKTRAFDRSVEALDRLAAEELSSSSKPWSALLAHNRRFLDGFAGRRRS